MVKKAGQGKRLGREATSGPADERRDPSRDHDESIAVRLRLMYDDKLGGYNQARNRQKALSAPLPLLPLPQHIVPESSSQAAAGDSSRLARALDDRRALMSSRRVSEASAARGRELVNGLDG